MNALKLVLVGLTAAALWAFLPVKANAVDGPHGLLFTGGCKECHKPHQALSGTLLLWGRTYSTKTTSWSDTTQTSGGTILPKNLSTTWTGSTRNCLSCHDGTNTSRPFTTVTAGNVDMISNHAVAVPFPLNNLANTYNGITTYGLAQGTALPAGGFVASPVGVKLYSDPVATGPNNKGIECGSCHDPHNHAGGDPVTKDYLRVNYATASAICTACHVK